MVTTKDEASLKRLGGGRWQTRDERFTIEPQSGTWAVVDAEQTDELGLPLVRGPFASLTAAKAAITEARAGAPPTSPLGERAERRPAPTTPRPPADPQATTTGRSASTTAKPAPAVPGLTAPPAEPRWLTALEPDERRRARRLIATLTAAGADDPEGLVRRDLAGDVPAIATHAIDAALRTLGPEATPEAVARLLADGHDADLGVRWRLVDDKGRRISLER